MTTTETPMQQLPLWPHALRGDGRGRQKNHVGIPALELARMLPPYLSLEFTREHGWRIVALSIEARRALELLDVYEGDVIPDAVTREARRRHVHSQRLVDQALNVLRAVQAENEARAIREKWVA